MIPRDRPDDADVERLAEVVADFLYDWEDTGENPSSAARRLLALIFPVKGGDQPVR